MTPRILPLIFALALALVPSASPAKPLADFAFQNGDRVVLLGNTLVERAQRYGYLETALLAGSGAADLTFRNLGWSGDDVLGSSRGRFGFQPEGFKHLRDHVLDLEPTVLIVSYGGNEAFAGEAGLADFEKDLGALLDVLEETGARILFLGPPRQEALGGALPDPAAHNADLALYAAAIGAIAEERGHYFLDLGQVLPVKDAPDSPNPALTYNSIHLTPEGYAKAAEVLCEQLRLAAPDWPALEEVRERVIAKNELYFHRWRPQNETYLTLFRKHEQGNNAAEIPQFDPLIEEAESAIRDALASAQKP
ncbi:hypothetical protein BH23VER1_BH23VER1_21820 [soil metagenome]